MVFIYTWSRRNDNPYSSPRSSFGRTLWNITSALPKTRRILAFLLVLWFVAIVSVVNENADIKKEVLDDIQREEKLIKDGVQRDRLRVKEWVKNEKRWLRDRLDPDGRPATPLVPPGEAGGQQHPWDLTRLEDLALRTGPHDTPIHVVFSTDCSAYQHWQAYLFFVACMRVRQPGRVTRIVSGCTETETRALQEWHAAHVAPLSFRFGVHLTPEFSNVTDAAGNTIDKYEFFNKPLGLKHWMEHGEGMGIDEHGAPRKHDTIVALLDPDQILVRPITGHFSSPHDIFRGGPPGAGSGHNVDTPRSFGDHESQFTVRHGHPAAQEYGLSGAWLKYASVAGINSPATRVSVTEALRSYAAGPPYVATALDMYAIARAWCAFVPQVYRALPSLMAEMYAFSLAAAHLRLPHQLLASLMVSDTQWGGRADPGGGEGWAPVDAIPGEEVCAFALHGLDADARPLPSALHFCQRYGVGDHAFFAKKKLPATFFSCASPLLEEPATDIGSGKYLYRTPPFVDKRKMYSALVEKREAFMICAATGLLNEAAQYYKNKHCGDEANLKKEISLHDLPE